MLIVPLQSYPSQQGNIVLSNQACTIKVYQCFYGLFMDLYVDNNLIVAGVECQLDARIVRTAYLGFTGDFVWIDTQGQNAPYYAGIGSRFFLVYLEEGE